MILLPSQIRAIEEQAFCEGATAEALMETAGAGMASAVRQFFPRPGLCLAVFGKGHNGGDALVAARHLAQRGWEVHLAPAFADGDWSTLTKSQFKKVGSEALQPSRSWEDALSRFGQHRHGRPIVVLDGLLGTGASAELREPVPAWTRKINALRENAGAHVFALDLPTGLDGATGEVSADCVIADVTLAAACAKPGLIADSATRAVGRLAIVPLETLEGRFPQEIAAEDVATPRTLAPLLPRRTFELHKGDCGRVTILAGSRGLTGAARLTAEACVRAGAGLVTLCISEDSYAAAAGGAPPEVMVRPIRDYREILELRSDILAIGPGLGQERASELLDLIRCIPTPAILDADALNILATDITALDQGAGPRLLTPHPGEMARLDPSIAGLSRREIACQWCVRHPGTLLLKGARTIVAERGRPASYNTTGNPGMATGGMGDTLTGVCAALAAQGLSLYDAARLGAWLCGHAAELAISHGHESVESLTPSRLMDHLGLAFENLRARCW